MRLGHTLRRPAYAILGLTPLVIFLAYWQVFGTPRDPRFPPPSDWIAALVGPSQSSVIPAALGSTMTAFVYALLISTIVGAALGLLLGMSRRSSRALGPGLEVLRVLPPPTLVPVAVLLIGATTSTTVLVAVFGAIWPVMFNTAAAVGSIPDVRIEMSRTLGLSQRERITKVVLPSLIPGITLGVRVAAPLCLVVVLVAEMLASTGGIGHLLIQAQRSYSAASVFGLLALVGGMGLVLSLLVFIIERVLARNFNSAVR